MGRVDVKTGQYVSHDGPEVNDTSLVRGSFVPAFVFVFVFNTLL